MLLLLFRSLTLAVLGIVPNLLAAGAVLGSMGLLGIPLDFMTITVAAVTIGIAVDNAIHYIYRFREEFARSGDYVATMHVCHANIGRAVFYTSATIHLRLLHSRPLELPAHDLLRTAHGARDGDRAAGGAHAAAEAHPGHEALRRGGEPVPGPGATTGLRTPGPNDAPAPGRHATATSPGQLVQFMRQSLYLWETVAGRARDG